MQLNWIVRNIQWNLSNEVKCYKHILYHSARYQINKGTEMNMHWKMEVIFTTYETAFIQHSRHSSSVPYSEQAMTGQPLRFHCSSSTFLAKSTRWQSTQKHTFPIHFSLLQEFSISSILRATIKTKSEYQGSIWRQCHKKYFPFLLIVEGLLHYFS